MMEFDLEEDKMEKKMTHLLLNTPGACFLCLQDIERDNDGGIVDLNSVCRYLNISQGSLLLTSLENDGGTGIGGGLEHGQCTFSVNLCPKCQELTEKLNDMIVQLEKAKLMVNFHLSSFHNILEGNEEWEESLEWINLLGRMHASPNNSFEAKLVELLRKETEEKSLKILKKAEAAKPQVILPKLTAMQPAPPPPPSQIFPAFDTSKSAGTSMKTHLNQLVNSCVIPSKKAKKAKLYRCPHCTKILTSSKVAVHLACQHSDKVLSSYFPLSSLPPSEDICRQVLQLKVIDTSVKIKSSSSSSSASHPRMGCHLCGITYSDGNLLKQHFLITHTNNLCQEINNFVKNSLKFPPKKKSTSKNPPPRNAVENHIKILQASSLINPSNQDKDTTLNTKVTKRCQCPFCDISTEHCRLPRHVASLHPDKLLAPLTTTHAKLDKFKNDNPTHFSQLCRRILKIQVSKAVKEDGGDPSTSAAASSSSSKLGCHLCVKICSDNRILKHHLLVNHTDVLIEELIKMENGKIDGIPDKQKQRKKKVIKKVTQLRQVAKESSGKKMEAKKSCGFCGLSLSDNCKLRRHQVTQHSDQLFLKCKPSGMGERVWRGICKEVFGGEVKQAASGMRGSKIYKCGFCPPGGEMSYKGQVEFEMHLAYQHREKMKGKLRDKVEGMKEEVDGGGDHMVFEEDASEFDVEKKPEVEEDINFGELEEEYGLFEEEDGGESGGDRKRRKVELGPLRKMRGSTKEDKNCTICGLAFFHGGKLRRHVVNQHPEQLFLKIKPSWMGEEMLRGNCKEVFGMEVKEATCGKPGAKIYKCGYCVPRGKTSYKGHVDLVVHLAYQHRGKMEERLEEYEKRRNMFGGGDEEVEDGGDQEDMEEDASELDIGGLHEMLYPDMVMDEGEDNLEGGGCGYQEGTGGYLDQYGYLEEGNRGDQEVDGGDGLMIGHTMTTEENLEVPDIADHAEPVPVLPIIKMEVNEAITLDDMY